MAYNDLYFYNRDNSVKSDFVYQTGLASTGSDNIYKPTYGSSVQYTSKLNFFESTNNSLKALPASENNLTATYNLKFLLTENDAGNLLKTVETAGGYKFLNFNDPSNIYKHIVGTVSDYEVIKLNKSVTEFRLQVKSSIYCPLFDWRTSSFLKDVNSTQISNLNLQNASLGKPWDLNTSYKKYDFVFVQTNFDKEILSDSFYFAKNDITYGKQFDINDWSKNFIYDFKGQFDLKNTIDVFTSDFKNSFYQTIKYRENSNVLKSFSLKFENINDLQCVSMLFFLEKRCGYRRFKYDFPYFLKKEKVFICTQWVHTFKYNDCHDIDVTFIEDPNALNIVNTDDVPILLSTNITDTINANVGVGIILNTTFRSSTPINYTWKQNGVDLQNNSASLSITNAQASNAGSYTLTATNSIGDSSIINFAININYYPVIIYNLNDQYSDYANSSGVSFTVGTLPVSQSTVSDIRLITYKWYYKDSNNANPVLITTQDPNLLISSDSATLTVKNPTQNYFKLKNSPSYTSRTYYATLSNAYMVNNNIAPIKTNEVGIIPTSYITKPIISSLTTFPTLYGNSATLTSSASGFSNLTYQWFKDGNSITNATSSTYTINNINDDSIGKYTVKVTTSNDDAKTDLKNVIESDFILVSTSNFLKFTNNANIANAYSNTTATFNAPSVTYNSIKYNLNYQWYKNGSIFTNSTSKTAALTLSSTSVSDIGYYHVVITTVDKSLGTQIGDSITSNPAAFIFNGNYAPVIIYSPSSVNSVLSNSHPLNIININSSNYTSATFLLSDLQNDSLNTRDNILILGNTSSYSWVNTPYSSATSTTSSGAIFNLSTLTAAYNNLKISATNSTYGTSTSNNIVAHIMQAPQIYNGAILFGTTSVNVSNQDQIVQINDYSSRNFSFQFYSDSDVTVSYILKYLIDDQNGNVTEVIENLTYNISVVDSVTLTSHSKSFDIAKKINSLDYVTDVDKYSKSNIFDKYLRSISASISNKYGTTQTQNVILKINPVFNSLNLFFLSNQTISLMEGFPAIFNSYVYGLKLSYKWYKNGIEISNSNSKYLKINAVTQSDKGVYTLAISSGYDSTTKQNTSLSYVTNQYSITVDYIFSMPNGLKPPNILNTTLTGRSRFAAITSLQTSIIPSSYSTRIVYQWSYSSSFLTNTDIIINNSFLNYSTLLVPVRGAVKDNFEITSVGLNHQGSYSLIIGFPVYVNFYLKNSDGSRSFDLNVNNSKFYKPILNYATNSNSDPSVIFANLYFSTVYDLFSLYVIPIPIIKNIYIVLDEDQNTKISYSIINSGLGVNIKRPDKTYYNSITIISEMSDDVNYSYSYSWTKGALIGTGASTVTGAISNSLKINIINDTSAGKYLFLVRSSAGSITSPLIKLLV
jgi:phage-related protein